MFGKKFSHLECIMVFWRADLFRISAVFCCCRDRGHTEHRSRTTYAGNM